MGEIFQVGFETGDLSEFSSTSGSGLSAGAAAAMCGSFGMIVNITSTSARYGERSFSQLASATWRYGFYIDTNSLSMSDGDTFDLIRFDHSGSLRSFFRLGFDAPSQYYLRGTAHQDDGSGPISSKVNITDGVHRVECVVHYATGPSANDGRFQILVDGVDKANVFSLDIFNQAGPSNVRIGAVAGIDSGTSGPFYLDRFVLRDDNTEIGACGGGPAGFVPAWAINSNKVIL